jgi:ferredoxin-NADP reductase
MGINRVVRYIQTIEKHTSNIRTISIAITANTVRVHLNCRHLYNFRAVGHRSVAVATGGDSPACDNLNAPTLYSIDGILFYFYQNNKMAMEAIVKIISIQKVTHDVKHYRVEKPAGYVFEPGQATEVSINQEKWKEERRPFTFTSLNEWPHLEFTIKSYKDHDGVTNALSTLKTGDELILRDVWGAIAYKGEGYFIAGGAGITPFIAILRQLHLEKKVGANHLFFSNKTSDDIILEEELTEMLGDKVHFLVTKEADSIYESGHIDKDFLLRSVKDFSKPFYICGPDKMVEEISGVLKELGADPESVVFEK